MPQIRITKAADDQAVTVTLHGASITIPRDGAFHDVDKRFLPVLDDSSVEYEIAPARKKAGAGGAAGLGGDAAPPSPLDHDGRKGPGGSVKGYHATAAKGARRKAQKKSPAKGAK